MIIEKENPAQPTILDAGYGIPDRKSMNAGNCFLYVMQVRDFYKIGISCDIEGRLRDIQCSNPETVTPVCWYLLKTRSNAIIFEKTVHAFLHKHRVHGEWFSSDQKTITAIINAINSRNHGNR